MKLDYHPYSLRFKQGGDRTGALLRVKFEDGLLGYADCHPWELFGDKPLEYQLEYRNTPLMERSLYFARLDAEARHKGVNLFEGLTIPKSHFLITALSSSILNAIDRALNQGYTRFKMKLGRHLGQEIPILKEVLKHIDRVRLDFNMSLNQTQFQAFLEKLGDLKKIEFIEDPFPCDLQAWKYIQETYQVALASDLDCEGAEGHADSARVLVIKPAIQPISQTTNQRVVITSYLDHPLGQLCAAYCAAQTKSTEVCGLQSHLVYEATCFSSALGNSSPFLQVPEGTGFGFDQLLAKLEWKKEGSQTVSA